MKHKKQSIKTGPLPPRKYIMQRGRSLPIETCWISPKWKTAALVIVIIARRHANGNYTLGIYKVDPFCTGVKQSFDYYNITEFKYQEVLDGFSNLEEVSYNEVHNFIYGAIAFAREAGIEPGEDFALTQYLLEEDTDDIPLIEYEYGHEGVHFLLAETREELNRYLPALQKNLKEDEYKYYVLKELVKRSDWHEELLNDYRRLKRYEDYY